MPCGIIHQIVWGTSVNSLALILKTISLFLPCKLIFWKATKVGSPPYFPKLISQLRGIPQPQYFVPSLLEPHWTYFLKHYIYHKKDTKVGSQILATKFGFVLDCLVCSYLCIIRNLTCLLVSIVLILSNLACWLHHPYSSALVWVTPNLSNNPNIYPILLNPGPNPNKQFQQRICCWDHSSYPIPRLPQCATP